MKWGSLLNVARTFSSMEWKSPSPSVCRSGRDYQEKVDLTYLCSWYGLFQRPNPPPSPHSLLMFYDIVTWVQVTNCMLGKYHVKLNIPVGHSSWPVCLFACLWVGLLFFKPAIRPKWQPGPFKEEKRRQWLSAFLFMVPLQILLSFHFSPPLHSYSWSTTFHFPWGQKELTNYCLCPWYIIAERPAIAGKVEWFTLAEKAMTIVCMLVSKLYLLVCLLV